MFRNDAYLKLRSSWNTFRYNVTQDLIIEIAQTLVTSGLYASGYEYVLIDDGWTACLEYNSDGGCIKQVHKGVVTHSTQTHHHRKPPRLSSNGYQIPVDSNKFPNGMAYLTDKVSA